MNSTPATEFLIKLSESITDCHHSTPEFTSEGKMVVRSFNVKNGRLLCDKVSFTTDEDFKLRTSRATPQPGDLIITREAPMGEVCIVPDDLECCLGQRLVLIRPNTKKVDSKYLLYTILSSFVQNQILSHNSSGSTVSNLRIPVLKELEIPYVELGMQQKIAAVLSVLDDKIELNRRINTELEQMARTLYDYWFVQFDFPDANGKPYKSSGGAMKFSPELNRQIPTGWKVCELQERCTSYLGGTPSRKNINYWNSNDIAWLSSGEVANFPIIDSEEKISKDGLRNSAAQLLDKGSVMISITGNIRVSILGIDASANQSVVGITPTEKVSSEYLYLYISRLVPKLEAMMTGAVQKHINKKVIDEIQLLVPEQSILREFDSIVKPMYEKILVNSQESQKLAHLRDWLLPMLMNGQVKVL